MANLEKAVNEFTRISKSMGYNINPPYTGKLETYDFGRDISPEQPDFWKQYGSFLRISNGSFADGCVFYGMSGGEDDAGLIEFNNALNIPDFKDETMTGLIVIGGNNTDVTNGAIVIHTQRLKSDPGGNLLS
ncbi:YrhA family protein [Yersinia pestis]